MLRQQQRSEIMQSLSYLVNSFFNIAASKPLSTRPAQILCKPAMPQDSRLLRAVAVTARKGVILGAFAQRRKGKFTLRSNERHTMAPRQ